VPVSIIPKSFLKCGLSNAEDGTQDDILWYDSEQSEQRLNKTDRNAHTVKILNFHFILVYFPLLFTLNLFRILLFLLMCSK
jgi:hypothetical protein